MALFFIADFIFLLHPKMPPVNISHSELAHLVISLGIRYFFWSINVSPYFSSNVRIKGFRTPYRSLKSVMDESKPTLGVFQIEPLI